MKASIKHSALALLVMAAGYNVAMADPVNINITGNVIASPCTVDTANSNLNVNLGNIQATDLATAGATSPLVPFQLKLMNCPAGTNQAIATFSGTPDTTTPTRYANTGTATNVAVEVIQASTGNLKGQGTQIGLPIAADKTVTYNLQSRAYAKAAVAPGTISSVVQVAFTYN